MSDQIVRVEWEKLPDVCEYSTGRLCDKVGNQTPCAPDRCPLVVRKSEGVECKLHLAGCVGCPKSCPTQQNPAKPCIITREGE